MSDRLRILIADDNESDRVILSAILKKQGHDVVALENGTLALESYKQHVPDIVLLDALMPIMNGVETAEAIRKSSEDSFVPIIFITALQDANQLADCLEAGGDDFLLKPYNSIILDAKIQAHARIAKLHQTVAAQRNEILAHRDRLLREQNIAKSVFDGMALNGFTEASNIKTLLSPMAVFNGDMVLSAKKPCGGMLILLGDFTGHGLPAAIGALPVSEIFYGMSKKGFELEEILREVNSKLHQILPVGIFCCACILDLSFDDGIVKYWIGGLPDIFIQHASTAEVSTLTSSHLPLGVLSKERFDGHSDVIKLDYDDRIYLWSDGIHEAQDSQGKMFGDIRLKQLFLDNSEALPLFDKIIQGVNEFTGTTAQDDDYTMVEITMVPNSDQLSDTDETLRLTSGKSASNKKLSAIAQAIDCTITCDFETDALKNFNPIPFLSQFFREVPSLAPHSGKLYTIITELYSNALEHGLLKLSSSMKNSSEGFHKYYQQRELSLGQLKEGRIFISLCCKSDDSGGKLIMIVEDTGEGFDHEAYVQKTRAKRQETLSGRGLPLLDSLCEKVVYKGCGNQVEVHYVFDIG